ncbi:MAG: TonB-dependent receptor [Candidatus Eisenbacteria bacterium]|uniref:TonB-dependent receptor n=1 Tax=Eiseniibacteriota bacterium TaxID=2212470 RepID=A0A948RXW4_UNCEI|nr:TonB-dependent receptor [Candidatus Eisenbacteria bacterium]MBU2691577.1 TonB-dependent receptor [Candidatus Eisenbacteria bacterium]
MELPRFHILLILILLPLCLVWTPVALADNPTKQEKEITESFFDMSLEELLFIDVETVLGASRFYQKTTEAPASVTIIERNEIAAFGYRTLAGILAGAQGFFTTNDRNYEYLGVRGFNRPGDYNTRVLLLVDGHRINDNIYDQATIGTEFLLDAALIERVEIIRGPASSLYGANAFLGVINVVTRDGRALNGFEVSGGAGSFETFRGRLSYGAKMGNGLSMILSGSILDSRGQDLYFKEFDDPETNNGVAEGGDGDKNRRFFTKLSYGDFTLVGASSSREKKIPAAPWGIEFNSSKNLSVDTRYYLDLKYAHLFDGQWSVTSRLFYDRYEYDGDFQFDYGDEDERYLVVNRDRVLGEWWGNELLASGQVGARNRITTGFEYRDNFRQDQKNYDEEVYLDDKRKSKIWALFLQDEFEISSTLRLNAGMRYDHYETFGGSTNPRLALIFNPYETSALKLLYGEAFRSPNAYELYYDDGESTQKQNPNLEPETITTYEMVWEQSVNEVFRFCTSGYIYHIRDLISQRLDPEDDLLVFDNSEHIKAQGLEMELKGRWDSGWRFHSGYALQRSENFESGEELTNSPRHIVQLKLLAPLPWSDFLAGFEAKYIGSRKTLAGSMAEEYWIANLTASGRPAVDWLEISAGVHNLFDEIYGDPGSAEHRQNLIFQDGRTVWVELKFDF